MSDSALVLMFRRAMLVRNAMKADGASEAEYTAALEQEIRAHVPVVPESDWPEWARVPRCVKCDGYGLVIRSVVNRLRITVNEATPCVCHKGDRFRHQPPTDQDYGEAGKAKPKPKGFSRWNG